MTKEENVYAETLNLFGSDLIEPPEVEEILHKLHDDAEGSGDESVSPTA